jgi:hypothetical protein
MIRTTATPVLRASTIAIALAGAITGAAHAQVPWESPQLLAPGTRAGLTMMYVDYGLRPDDGTGLLMAWRGADAPHGMGLRLAGTLPQEDDIRLSGGVDIGVPMFDHSAAFPLDVMWTSGFGASYGDYYSVGFPVGAAASRVFAGDNVWLLPYTSARMVLEGYFGPDHPDESFGLALAADVGLDVSLHRSNVVLLRAAMSFGDRRALSIGLQLSPGSGAARTAAR